ncbi:hypothetical protein ACQ4PT_012585 [Festuca glaucescens]
MAMAQAGFGVTRVVMLMGAGMAGSVVLRNGRLSEILTEMQEFLEKADKGKEGGGGADHGISDALNEVRLLAMQVRQLGSPRSITVLNRGSGQSGLSGLIVPAATVGALGYGYMWWKGISFADLMYVTKQNMANVVSSMTKHLEQVQTSLAAAKKHLTQRIEKLDDKLDQQKALSGQIKDDVTGARLKLDTIGSEIKNIKDLVWGLDEKMDSMEAKQNFSCAGVMYLCQFIEQNGGKLPERLEGIKPSAKRFSSIGIQGLQLAIETGDFSEFSNADSTDKISSMTAIIYRKVRCSYLSLVSKKHYFFSYIGENILKYNNKDQFKLIRNAFKGASLAKKIDECELLFFPICHCKHWFLFVVDLQNHLFVFMDSLFSMKSLYQVVVRGLLVGNFKQLWKEIVDPEYSFDNFRIVYPAIPRQGNGHDCGVFVMKCMEIWTPGVDIRDYFSAVNIPNIRVQYANQLFFSSKNTADKSLCYVLLCRANFTVSERV